MKIKLSTIILVCFIACIFIDCLAQKRRNKSPSFTKTFVSTNLSIEEKAILKKASLIWERQEQEAWQNLAILKIDNNNCKCGESYEYIEARHRWSDIHMAEHYFRIMKKENN